MAIPVVCPECEHHFSVRDEYLGKRGKCPSCGGVFRAEPAQVSTAVGDSIAVVPASTSRNGASPASNGESWGNFNNESLAIAAPNARKLQSKQVPAAPAAPAPAAAPPAMSLAGWITIGVLGVSATVGAVLLYTSNVGSAKAELAAAVEKVDSGSRADEIKKQYQTELKQLNDEIVKLKALLDATENGTREVATKPNVFEDQLVPACVKVKAYDDKKTLLNTASGFFVDDKCTLVTTYDVLAGATRVGILAASRFEHEALGLLAADPKLNLAVLRLKEPLRGLKPLKLANNSKLIPGQTIYSFGNPGRQEFTVARGIITRVISSEYLAKENQSFYGSEFKPSEATFTYVEHDARIFPGDFGGPLLNDQYEVIGVNLAVATMIMNDRVTVVPTLGGACTVDNAAKLIASAKDTPIPYPPAKKGKKSPKSEPDDKKEGDPKAETPEKEPADGADEGAVKMITDIEAAAAACNAFGWAASNAEEYGKLTAFAKLLFAARKDFSTNADVLAAVRDTAAKLGTVEWTDAKKLAINKLVAANAPKKDDGTFFVGKLEPAVGSGLLFSVTGTGLFAHVPDFDGPTTAGKEYVLAGVYSNNGTGAAEVTGSDGKKKRIKIFQAKLVGGIEVGAGGGAAEEAEAPDIE